MTTSSIPFLTRRAVNPILTEPTVVHDEAAEVRVFMTPFARRAERYLPLIGSAAAGLFLLTGYLTQKVHGGEATPFSNACVLLAFVLAGIPGLQAAWESLLERRVDIDVLMILGAGLAAVIGQPIEGALLLFLFATSGALEEEATRRTQSAIRSLRDLNPDFALVLDAADQPQRVGAHEVAVGARLLVRPGDRVPLDGVIVQGESAIDESPITGESIPRDKNIGEPVYAGTINGSGALIVQVTKVAAETQLAKIIKLVTEAPGKQARVERLFDRISPKYTLCVISAAVCLGVLTPLFGFLPWDMAARRAIALLIVASPCALIIATPIAYLSAIASAARQGVLIKGGVYLEVLARCRAVVFDKTGTLTVGRPRVAQVVALDGLSESEALRVAGALECSSSHPLANAVNCALDENRLVPYLAAAVEQVPGRGVRGRIDGEEVAFGRGELAGELLPENLRRDAMAAAEAVYAQGLSAAVIARGGQAAVIAFEDPIREDARHTLATLREQGVRRLIMLTGDHARVARRTADALALDGFFADLLPEDKIAQAEQIRSERGAIAVVGDGVNDAPVLAHADVGIAMASIGSDAALEAAPVVLMSNRLERLAWLFKHARRTAGTVRQNLALALAVIVVLSGFAVAGKVELPLAVVAHEGSTLVVALNALRLLRS